MNFTITALDLTKPAHDLSAYIFVTGLTEKEARSRVARLLHAGTFSQISIKPDGWANPLADDVIVGTSVNGTR